MFFYSLWDLQIYIGTRTGGFSFRETDYGETLAERADDCKFIPTIGKIFLGKCIANSLNFTSKTNDQCLHTHGCVDSSLGLRCDFHAEQQSPSWEHLGLDRGEDKQPEENLRKNYGP